jgi:hypothetical protein
VTTWMLCKRQSITGLMLLVVTNLDVPAIQELIHELDSTGYGNMIYLMSVGGRNGAHLDHNLGALAWYQAFRTIRGLD